MRIEIERLRRLREDVRKKELKFKKMEETARDITGYKEPISVSNYFHHPEYKLQSVYRDIGWELTNKIDSLLTFLEEHDTK